MVDGTDRPYDAMVRDGDKPRGVADVTFAAMKYLAVDDTGGPLHIILEDGNLETVHVAWCLELAVRCNDYSGAALAHGILLLSMTQRRVMYGRLHGERDG